MRKKGQIGSLQNVIMILVMIGLLLGIGFLILEEFKGNLSENTATISNETLSSVTESCEYVEYNSTTAGINCYNGFSPMIVTNASNGLVISSTNYTYSSTLGKICAVSSTFNNSDWNVSYTYQYGEEACKGVNSAISATQKVPTWLGIIVILAIVGILIAIVFSVLPRATTQI